MRNVWEFCQENLKIFSERLNKPSEIALAGFETQSAPGSK